MFERYEPTPPDPILGLIAAHRDDPFPDKVDLGVGVYRDEQGVTPLMAAVSEAEQRLATRGGGKAYFGQAGDPEINPLIQALVLGDDDPGDGRVMTMQTPGGSGALRVAAALLVAKTPGCTIWVPTPTWANHVPLLGSAGATLQAYRYYDAAAGRLDVDGMLEDLAAVGPDDVVLVHAACHNPTGADLDTDAWKRVIEHVRSVGCGLMIDGAYQGFADGLDADAAGVRAAARAGIDVLVTTSFSKNFGLYRDRAGALTFIGVDADQVAAAHSNSLRIVRTMYSTPPAHGPAVVAEILRDDELRTMWTDELDHMRRRLHDLRGGLVDALTAAVDGRFEFIRHQRGMFSLLGITEEQAGSLVADHHVYLTRDGRINVAGTGPHNVEIVARAVAAVLDG